MVSTVTCTMSGTSRPAVAIARRARDDRGLALEEVLDGLDQEDVDAAGEQAGDLRLVVVAQLGERDLAERREAGAGADRADHEAGPVGGGELGRHLLGEAGRRAR